MKTHSTITRLCLASLPAFALTLSAAEGERRENPGRPPEQRESRREPRPEGLNAPRNHEREAASSAPSTTRRPGGELSRELSNRPAATAPRSGAGGQSPGPQAQRSNISPRNDGAFRPPMASQHDGGNPQEREQHLRQAIEHLRMAGVNDLAEHLQQNLSGGNNPRGTSPSPQANHERSGAPGGNRHNFQPPAGAGPQGRNFTPPMGGASPNELRELHEQVAQLKKMVEELAHQRR